MSNPPGHEFTTKRRHYDVFLSFRGKDTRKNFTSHLLDALRDKGIKVFFDDDSLRRGSKISLKLLSAIEESAIAVVVFSKNYASSTWCLKELAKIIERHDTGQLVVLPVFFQVEPNEVRKQRGSYAKAFERHEKKFKKDLEMVEIWRKALQKAADFSGWTLGIGSESQLVQSLVQDVLGKLERKQLHVADFPVSLEYHVHLIVSALVTEPMVGLCGLGGIGKTTIAKAVFNLIADFFDGSCFLANVRETSKLKGPVQLQKNLLSDVLGVANFHINYVDEGVNIIRDRLGQKKILVVVDDVDHLDQLRKLVGDYRWFGLGSKVIITTRDEHLLIAHGVNFRYKVPGLGDGHALKLFVHYAFGNNYPNEEFKSPIRWMVNYAKGLPLALVVLGSFLRGKSLTEWHSAMCKLKKIPNNDINDVLKISFDGLEEEEKAIFLDLACFFRGKDVEFVMKVLTSCGFNATIGLKILIERSLASIHYNKLEMHDLLQLMGREIVRQESASDPGKRSRLWSSEDILCVLSNNLIDDAHGLQGTRSVEGMMAVLPESEEVFLSANTFNKMRRIKLLSLHNAQYSGDPVCFFNDLRLLEWPKMCLPVLEFNGGPKKLVEINMFGSKFTKLGKGFKNFKYLTSIDFRNCEGLINIPDFSTIPNLEVLLLNGCKSLVEVHESIGYLSKLVTLNLHSCCNLQSFPSVLHLINLEDCVLTGCSNLTMFPYIAESMIHLRELRLQKTRIEELPPSIERLEALRAIYLDGCENLSRLPMSIYILQHLHILSLSGCMKLEKLPKKTSRCSNISALLGIRHLYLKNCNLQEDKLLNISYFASLIHLDLSENPFVCVPSGVQRLHKLQWLGLNNCQQLLKISNLPISLKQIHARGCKSLESIRLSQLFLESPMFEHLDFSNCNKEIWLADYPSSEELRRKSCARIYLPGSEIPRWFNYQNEGDSLRLHISLLDIHKCGAVALCAIFGLDNSPQEEHVDMKNRTAYTIFFYVDEVCILSEKSYLHPIESDHMALFFDAQCLRRCRFMVYKNPTEYVDFVVWIQVHDASNKVVLRKVGIYLPHDCDDDLESSLEASTDKAESSKKKPKLRQDYHAQVDRLPMPA